MEKKVTTGKLARPINNTDIIMIHLEAIAILTNPEIYHPVKL
ncbi:hypothetical protein [Okeania sp. SIO2B3]|nr:hypothetical protein [Okeania sp. SIO2B3]